jgi:hypothetical protein
MAFYRFLNAFGVGRAEFTQEVLGPIFEELVYERPLDGGVIFALLQSPIALLAPPQKVCGVETDSESPTRLGICAPLTQRIA